MPIERALKFKNPDQQATYIIIQHLQQIPPYSLLINHLITTGRLRPKDVRNLLGVSYPTARQILHRLAKMLGVQLGYTRNKKYRYCTIKLTKVCGSHSAKLYRYLKRLPPHQGGAFFKARRVGKALWADKEVLRFES